MEKELKLDRRQFLKLLGFTILGKLIATEAMVVSDTPLWPVSHTRQWLPFFEHVANRRGVYQFKSTYEPNNVWNIYDTLEEIEFGRRGHSREFAEYWENFLWADSQKDRDDEPEGNISREEESWGLCYEMAKIRSVWPVPALGNRVVNGQVVNERGLFHLLGAAGSHVVKTNVRWDQAGIQDRLAQFVEGRDRRTPLVRQSKPDQPGIWYRNIGGVSESLTDTYVDDFNLPPIYLPTYLIQEIFDPYLVTDSTSIPDHLRGEVEDSFASDAAFPINIHLVYRILYQSPVA